MVYKICSFSGGGIRGIVPATIIQEILEMSKKYGGSGKITDFCDHVVGTSAGGIVAAGLVVSDDKENAKYDSSEITNMLFQNADKIFSKVNCTDSTLINALMHPNGEYLQYITSFKYSSVVLGALGSTLLLAAPMALAYYGGAKAIFATLAATAAIGGYAGKYINTLYQHPETICEIREYVEPKYSRQGIDNVLYQYFGNKTLTDTIIPFTTFSFSLSDGTVKSFSTLKANKSPMDNFQLQDALGSTSAAPTFFAHKIITVRKDDGVTKEHHEVDSGLYSNSPLALAIALIRKHGDDKILERIDDEGISILSIGTGLYIHKNIQESVKGEGILGWAPIATRTAMEGTEYISIIEGKYLHNSSRIDVEMASSIPMDASDSEIINLLQRLAKDKAGEPNIANYVRCVIENQSHCQIIGELPFENEFFL